MVFCGALSKGCERCRRRKIKCDQQKPACHQCVKARTPCPGYRSLADVMFRDESASVVRKMNGRHGESNRSGGNEVEVSAVTALAQHHHPELQKALSTPLEQHAASFFFANYVFSDPPFADTYLGWLSRLYWRESACQILHAVVEAVGMVGMSNVYHAPHLLKEARQQYGRALTITNKALRDPLQATMDSTIVAILFLGLYEIGSSTTPGARMSGGLQPFSSFEVDSNSTTSSASSSSSKCVLRSTAVPPVVTKWLQKPPAPQSNGEPSFQQDSLALISVSIASLRELIKNNPNGSPTTVISSALEIDADLSAYAVQLTSGWPYSTVCVTPKKSQECLDGFYHVYKYLWSAQLWNNYRLLHIMVHGIILQNLDRQSSSESTSTPPFTSISSQYQHSRTLIRQLCSDVCASVPSLLGSFPDHHARPQPSTQRATGALTLLWPLFGGVCYAPHIDGQMRQWAIGRLQYIDEVMGIRQAGLMAATMLDK